LVSNLPYQISSTLVMELSSIGRPLFKTMILMFQKEVAERINAKPETKEYGMLSVLAQNRWQIKKVVDAAPACFHPRPQVASRVLQFDYDESGFSSPQFLKFVKAGFQNRRKQVLKSLKGIDGNFDWTESLKSIGHPITARAEEISPLGWKALFLEHQQKVKLK
jgi:16S rRNA (adenine1518-N6/adenine1519-N6)-dimethyltransferase